MDRLSSHALLTSDKKVNKGPGLEATSGKEPNIFAFFYDTAIGVAEPDNVAGGGMVISNSSVLPATSTAKIPPTKCSSFSWRLQRVR